MKINFFKKRGANLLSAFFLILANLFASQGTISQVFNYTGSLQTFTVPVGVTSITVVAWGAGGAGAGGSNNKGFGGGGGGAYTSYVLTVIAGSVYNISIGQGGVAAGNPGGTGGDSSFYTVSTTLVSAQGATGGNYTASGLGGNAANGMPTSGAIRNSGGGGGTGSNNGGGGVGGGGGGSGGSGGAGGNGTAITGGAAGSGTGGNPGAAGGTGATNTNAAAGGTPGGGGGGNSNKLYASGGNGGNGRIVVSYLAPVNVNLSVTKAVDNLSPFVGNVVTFTMVAKSAAAVISVTANNVVLTDLLPSGYTFITANPTSYDQATGTWNLGSMNSGMTTIATITAIVNPTGIYTNTATIASTSQINSNTLTNSSTVTPIVCKASPTAPQVK